MVQSYLLLSDNPAGLRYQLPLDAKVMKIVYEHALRRIIYNNASGIAVSQWSDGLLITAGNSLSTCKKIVFRLGNVANLPKQITVTHISADNLGMDQFTITQTLVEPVDQNGQNVVEVVCQNTRSVIFEQL
jgi:hypothetical protein